MSADIIAQEFGLVKPQIEELVNPQVEKQPRPNPLTSAPVPTPKPKNPNIFVKLYMNYVTETGLFAEIKPAPWKALCALSKYINESGECWATEETLAKDLGISQQAVSASMTKLHEMLDEDGHRLVRITHRHKEDGSYRPNIYTLNPAVGLHIFQSTPFGLLLREERGQESSIFRGVTAWTKPKPYNSGLYGSLGDFLSLDTRRN